MRCSVEDVESATKKATKWKTKALLLRNLLEYVHQNVFGQPSRANGVLEGIDDFEVYPGHQHAPACGKCGSILVHIQTTLGIFLLR
jgi:hypothetical protein